MAAYKTLMTTVVQYFVPDVNISQTIDSMISIENQISNVYILNPSKDKNNFKKKNFS